MGSGSLSAVRTTAAKVSPDRRLGRHSIRITAAAISLTDVAKCRIPHYQRVGSRALEVKANIPAEILQICAWQDRWVDVSDIVEPEKAQYSETALVSGQAYNNVTKKVGQYGVPIRAAVVPCHIWRPLVEKAGLKIE